MIKKEKKEIEKNKKYVKDYGHKCHVVLILLVIFILSSFIFVINNFRKDNQYEFLEENANFVYSSLQNNIFSKMYGISSVIIKNTQIKDILVEKLKHDDENVPVLLNALKSFHGASVVYLMDAYGDVVSSTTYDEEGSTLTGYNYSFRPYFKDAIEGKVSIYPALGVTTDEKGIYFAYPVYDRNIEKPEGVLVIKLKLDEIKRLFFAQENPVMLVIDNNLIFLSNRLEWNHHFLIEPSVQTLEKIQREQQLEGLIKNDLNFNMSHGEIDVNDVSYLYSMREFPQTGWKIFVMDDADNVFPLTSIQKSLIIIAGFLLILQLIVIMYLYKNIRRRRYAEKHLEERVLIRTKELSESLEELQKTKHRLESSLDKLKNDEEAGRKLQMRLLPDSYKLINGYQFFHVFMPSMFLSGDFVDYFEIDEKRIAFYLADVSGHGVSSAFVTIRLESYMKNLLMNFEERKVGTILNPGKLLQKLNNDLIFENLGKHMTIFYGVIDTQEHTLKYANAGQFPYPIVRKNKSAEFIEVSGMPCGLLENTSYKSYEMDISEDFFLVLSSDGILELLPHKELKDKEVFLKSLITETGFGVNTLIEKSGIDDFQTLPDDVTILLIKRRLDKDGDDE
ncbi:MAG: SpoIIE family protein phosphatase [Candidatus Muiribacteriota bacterium]